VGRRPAAAAAPERSCLALVSVWLCLAAGARLGLPPAACFVPCCAAACIARPRLGRRDLHLAPVGLAIGAASLGCLLWTAGLVGWSAGLQPPAPARAPDAASAWIALVVLAPVFEEVVYRGPLLDALRAAMGTAAALALSAAAFAAPHGSAWVALACVPLGLALGALRLRTASLGLVIGAHAGVNLAGLVCLALPDRAATLASPAWGLVALGLLAACTARGASRRLPRVAAARGAGGARD